MYNMLLREETTNKADSNAAPKLIPCSDQCSSAVEGLWQLVDVWL